MARSPFARTSGLPHDTDSTPPAPLHSVDLDLIRAAAVDAAARARLATRLQCVPRFLVARNRRFGGVLPFEALEDLTQDVLTLIWRKRDEFRGDAALETWAYRICDLQLRNAVRQHLARRAIGVADPQVLLAQGVEPAEGADREAVHLAIDRLPVDEAAVVRMKHFEERTFDEMAAVLGISPNTAKTRYYRALEFLRTQLRPRLEDRR